jgi:hypothetical protein
LLLFLNQRAGVSAESFTENSVLLEVVNHYATARPHIGVRGIKLLHDEAPVHKSSVMHVI